MATYSSYKKVIADNLDANTQLTDAKFCGAAGKHYGVLWVRGCLGPCHIGCCCAWTVPSKVSRITFELWGAGGNGGGACACNRCHYYRGAGGGYYNTKTIDAVPGCVYTICAGGVAPCCQFDCCGCKGCDTYVTGLNLTGFCAIGGHGGIGSTDWSSTDNSCFSCCICPGSNGGDFAMGNHAGSFSGTWLCHCFHQQFRSTGAPFLTAGQGACGGLGQCWMRCGCFNVPYGAGGSNAMSSYCGSGCCGQGGMGGSGVVKVTFS